MSRPAWAARAVCLSLATLGAVAGCGSGRAPVGTGGTSTTGSPATHAPASTVPTTVAHQLPTVPDCGGGAFEPKTLLIVCGTGTTMATGVSWRSWGTASATGSGTVHFVLDGQAASDLATLTLSHVVTGPVGPQFSLLTVAWTNGTPTGRHQDTYRLQMQG